MYEIEISYIDKEESLVSPKKAHDEDVGYDLVSTIDVTLKSNGVELIPNGIVVKPPKGFYLQICSRSGLALKHRVFVGNSPGIIDPIFSSPKDQIHTILYNLSDKDFEIKRGDRVSQLILAPMFASILVPRKEDEEFLNMNERGGFGSTGI